MANNKVNERMINIVDTDASVGSISNHTLSHILFGSVMVFPQMNMVMMSSSNDMIKANKAPDTMAGLMMGIVISKKILNGFAPRLIAACSRLISNPLTSRADGHHLESTGSGNRRSGQRTRSKNQSVLGIECAGIRCHLIPGDLQSGSDTADESGGMRLGGHLPPAAFR